MTLFDFQQAVDQPRKATKWLYLLGSAVYVVFALAEGIGTVHTYCEMRPVTLAVAVVGVALVVRCFLATRRIHGSSRAVWAVSSTIALVGSALPIWMFSDAMRTCAEQAGK